ncbi:LOW QUALITY PROTEIN: zona pellucida sperm-binding protein 2-like [Bufo gargarizans]|uniref:LOW QUALITY PROTEIN: zona pellucida sperm-binding protein 2-like n=1 Tax=Bufo gargarizans TaxID=30331 RepID=UPI001CF551FF|nr:LOW QUALITY PROTEIN: zona pellucida sperm-binding protein 2-like [Bufo gargarizans]
MGLCGTGTAVPMFWRKPFVMRFLLVCLWVVLSDAVQVKDFPGSTFCLDSEIQIKKPKDVPWRTWRGLHVVDSSGFEVDACQILPEGSLLTIPEKCINHETGRRVAHLSLRDSLENNVVFQISCKDEQADSDSEYMEPVIRCTPEYMEATISRKLSGFDEEIVRPPPPASTWTIGIDDGTLVKLNLPTAKRLGYDLTSNDTSLTIRVNVKAFGIKELTSQGQKFYSGNIALIQERQNPKIRVDVKLICATGPPACNKTHMTLSIPNFGGILQNIKIGNKLVELTTYALQEEGITLDMGSGVQLSFELAKLQVVTAPNQQSYYLQSLTLVFLIDELTVPMNLNLQCGLQSPTINFKCTPDGFMMFEVLATLTKPNLDLNTVTVRDRSCQPQEKTSNRIYFKFALNTCGTTGKRSNVGGKLLYENEVSALWKELPRRDISRDSELRETIRCFYNGSDSKPINASVVTPPPPVSSRNDGPLLIVMSVYPDISYQTPYRDDQYPILKTLRDPIYLEVQVLNRNDPNIELVLDDCWATMSRDPEALPQWNVVVDGCQESHDSYLTVFHPVNNVPLATYRKRFEVKAFAFMQGGQLSTNFVYFHCHAIICDITSPDSSLCSKSCPPSRKRRDELFLHRHSTLASPPGPVLLLASEASLTSEDEQDVITQVTIGVLPAFALVAVIALVAVFINLKCKPES